MKKITLELPIGDIIDEWLSQHYGVELLWTDLELVTYRDYDTVLVECFREDIVSHNKRDAFIDEFEVENETDS